MNGAAAAGAAAAARRRREQEEEETMAEYGPRDLAEGWEFKFLRSATGAFRNPEFLKEVLTEEGKAGWTLVEKFDNGRIRVKRPAAARASDTGFSFDPYRTTVGISEGRLAFYIVAGVISVILLVVGIVAAVK
ncbi:MAG TPA: hypothetical protein VFI25_12105 [Planctomycetota bacterium]|jgi:hypothetical protein|nr:hypothetical protein [Planctomycetota bacterium]